MYLTIFLSDKKENISYFELILLGYIESFKKGCYKSTEDIAKDLKTNISSVRKALKHLVELKELYKWKTKGKHYKYTRFNEESKEIKETNQVINQLKGKWKKEKKNNI